MFRKRILSVSAAVVLGLSTVMVPTAGAQETGDTTVVTDTAAFDPQKEYPDVAWNDEGYSEPVSGDESLNCSVDWNAATILDQRLTNYQNNGFTKKVFDASHGGQSDGYSSLQHFYSGGTNAAWRPVVAFDADVNDATVVLTVPEAKAPYTVTDTSTWLVSRYFPAVNVSAYTTPVSPNRVEQSTANGVTTVTFHLGDVKRGSGFAAQVGGDVGKNGVTGSLHTTGTFVRGQETVEDCQYTFGYDDSFTHPGVEVEVNQSGEFNAPANTSYAVVLEGGEPKVTDADGNVYTGWQVTVDQYTGRLSITPPEGTDSATKYFVHVEATAPGGTPEQITAGVQVADVVEVDTFFVNEAGELIVKLVSGLEINLGDVITPGYEVGPIGDAGKVTIVNQTVNENGNTVYEFSDGTILEVKKKCNVCEADAGSSIGGSSALLGGSSALLAGSSKDGDNGGNTGGSSDARCVQAAATVGIPLLALLPIGLATQLNIPGLSPLVADAQAQLQAANTDLQQRSGIYNDQASRFMAQVNAELQKNGGVLGKAVGVAAVIAIGGLIGKYLYDNCVPGAPEEDDVDIDEGGGSGS